MTKVFSSRLKKTIDKYDVISFDVFDTLIKRNCLRPTDIFDICENKYNKNSKQKIQNFKNQRIKAEKEARLSSKLEDITFYEIYEKIECKNLIINDMKKIELETEFEYCVPNKEMYEIYNYCIKHKKKILFISDMYLDEKTIKRILDNNGYKYGELYVSSKYKSSKGSGNLYRLVLDKEHIKATQLFHIGDNKKSDYLIPKFLGIKSYKIKKNIINTSYIPLMSDNLSSNVLFSCINNNVFGLNQYEKIGYELLGPMCYSFCNWIHDTAKKKNITKLFFCARDMKIVQDAYNYLYGEGAISNEYFYVSRKSLKYPFLYLNDDVKSFVSLIPSQKMKMCEIFDMFNLNVDDKIIEDNGFLTGYYDNDSLKNDERFIKFYNDIIIKNIRSNKDIKQQYDNFIEYLNSMKFDKNSAIIDLGWMGTIQYSMQKILNYDIFGMYFGLGSNRFVELNNNSASFFLKDDNSKEMENKIYTFRPLFETFFASRHGTTLKYLNGNRHYELGNPDNYDNIALNSIQKYAINFIKDFKKYEYKLDKIDVVMNNFINIGINPSYSESVVFGDLKFDNKINNYLAKPKRLCYYIVRPNKFKKDFLQSEWKIGFLKRMLKIKMPYYMAYKVYKKIKKE